LCASCRASNRFVFGEALAALQGKTMLVWRVFSRP
jgi:hypothetical protein